MSLAESVVILMRYAAIKEINLNTEVQKPSLADVFEFQGEVGSDFCRFASFPPSSSEGPASVSNSLPVKELVAAKRSSQMKDFCAFPSYSERGVPCSDLSFCSVVRGATKNMSLG